MTNGQTEKTRYLTVIDAHSFEELWKREVFDADFHLDTELKLLDSLALIRLSDALHREFGIEVEFNEFQRMFSTPRKIIDDAKEKTVDTDKPLVSNTIFNSVDKHYERMIESFTSCNQEKWYYPLRKNSRPIIFLITSMRHGSSLTSFILNAHPDIYAPQGLYLLPFTNLSQRAEVMKNQVLFLDEGLINTVKDLWDTDQNGAEKIVKDWTQENLPIQEVYRNIQEQCAPRILVDRGTVYAIDQAVLNRAEHLFDSVKYIHLVRHPYAVLRSGTDLLAKTAFMRKRITREQFESESLKIHLNGVLDKLWSTTHINFLDFESQLDSNKCHRLKFESLVEDPSTNLKKLCEFLNISYSSSMLKPYEDSKNLKLHNMTGKNGIAAIDPNVMKQTQINPKNAHNWKLYSPKKALSASTLFFMKKFKYETSDQNYVSGFNDKIFMRIAGSGNENPVLAIPGTGGNLHSFQSIFSDFRRPVLGIKLGDYAPHHSFSELGAFLSSNIRNQVDSCSLIGYSSGALIAWETAAELKKKGVIVDRLILVDRNPYFPANELFVHEIEDAKRHFISTYGQGLEHDALITAYVVFANTFYGLKGNQLVNMIDALLKMRPDQESMKRAVEDYIPGVQRLSLDEFIIDFRNSRQLIETYEPTSMTDPEFDRVLIEPSGSPYSMNQKVKSDMRRVLIDDCDHFSIIKSPELNTIVRELL